MKRKDMKHVSFISILHDFSVITKTLHGVGDTKPKYVRDYSLSVLRCRYQMLEAAAASSRKKKRKVMIHKTFQMSTKY